MKTIHNPSACDVWIEAEDTPTMIRAGETKKL